jgi:hypothetical protein
MFVSCTLFVLSGRGLCDGSIPRPEESYRLWCGSECDQVKIKTLCIYCEQVGRRGKGYETKRIINVTNCACKSCDKFNSYRGKRMTDVLLTNSWVYNVTIHITGTSKDIGLQTLCCTLCR